MSFKEEKIRLIIFYLWMIRNYIIAMRKIRPVNSDNTCF